MTENDICGAAGAAHAAIKNYVRDYIGDGEEPQVYIALYVSALTYLLGATIEALPQRVRDHFIATLADALRRVAHDEQSSRDIH